MGTASASEPAPVYLDHHATTPVDPRVSAAMRAVAEAHFANPASGHAAGRAAARLLEQARARVAAAIGGPAGEIVFTSGATESNNLALFGACAGRPRRGLRLIGSAVEHPSVLAPLQRLRLEGARVTLLPVDGLGRVDPDDLVRAFSDDTRLVTLMAANNEVGTLQPIAEFGRRLAGRPTLFHSDAVQALGKLPFDADGCGLDMVSLNAHKLHGPKGVGALWLRGGVRAQLAPSMVGGGQEGGLRSGTADVAGAVGLATALEIAVAERETESRRLARLRDRLQERILRGLDRVRLNGDPDGRLPNNLHLSFLGIDGEALMLSLDDVALSTGSACRSLDQGPSHVLQAMGLDAERVRGSVRLGLGRFNDEAQVDRAADSLIAAVERLRRVAGEG